MLLQQLCERLAQEDLQLKDLRNHDEVELLAVARNLGFNPLESVKVMRVLRIRFASSNASQLQEPEAEPAQGRLHAAATETDACRFLEFSQHSFVHAELNERCQLCPASGFDVCRCAGSSGCCMIAATIAERSLDESAPLFKDRFSFYDPELWKPVFQEAVETWTARGTGECGNILQVFQQKGLKIDYDGVVTDQSSLVEVLRHRRPPFGLALTAKPKAVARDTKDGNTVVFVVRADFTYFVDSHAHTVDGREVGALLKHMPTDPVSTADWYYSVLLELAGCCGDFVDVVVVLRETASQTTREGGVVKERAIEEIAETELATETPARKGRTRGKNSGQGGVVKKRAIYAEKEIAETEPAPQNPCSQRATIRSQPRRQGQGYESFEDHVCFFRCGPVNARS